jgi:hypothetical protein
MVSVEGMNLRGTRAIVFVESRIFARGPESTNRFIPTGIQDGFAPTEAMLGTASVLRTRGRAAGSRPEFQRTKKVTAPEGRWQSSMLPERTNSSISTELFSTTEKVGSSEFEASRQGLPKTRIAVEVPPKSEVPTPTPYGELLSCSLTHVASISWTSTESMTMTEGGSTRVVLAWTLAVWSRSYVFLPLGTLPPGPRKVRPEVVIGVSVGAGLAIASIVAVIVHIRRRGESGVPADEAVAQEDPVMIVPGATSSGS